MKKPYETVCQHPNLAHLNSMIAVATMPGTAWPAAGT